MITIAVANQKGGVGKTTTACHLAHGLALKNYSVLLIDLDSQGQCSSALGVEKGDSVFRLLTAQPALSDVVALVRPNLWLLAGNKRTKTAEVMMVYEQAGASALKEILTASINGNGPHFIVMDTAPSIGGLQENALLACDILIVPCSVTYLALEGVAEILQTLQRLGRPELPATFILPTFFSDVTMASKENVEILRVRFGDNVLEPIHTATRMDKCAAVGKTIFEIDPSSRAAEEYGRLVMRILNVTNQQ